MRTKFLASALATALINPCLALAADQPQDAGAQAVGTGAKDLDTPTTAPDVQESFNGGDIVVTARRRDESLSKVPIAIAVLGGEELAKQAVRSEADLQSAVPGLIVKQTGSNNILSFAIRGQSIDAYTSSSPAVLPYVNEFQLVSYTTSSFFDLQNIQILKGPQGTLFGRNTTGGAVLYQTAEPGDEAEGFLTVRLGNLQEKQVTVAATAPLVDGIALRLAANYSDGGAFVRNLVDGKTLGENLNKTVRGTLRIKPADGIKTVTTLQYGTDDGTNTPTLPSYVNACGAVSPDGSPTFSAAACLYSPANPDFPSLLATLPGLFSGGLEAYPTFQRQLGTRQALANSSLRHEAETFYVINTTSIEVSEGLTLKNIIGYSDAKKNDAYDFDGTSYPIYENVQSNRGQFESARQFSEELQLQGVLGPLTFVVGGFYSDLSSRITSNGIFFGFLPVTYDFQTDVKSMAAFAQATYVLTNQLNLTVGGRYSRDKIVGRNLPASVFGATRQERDDSKPSWTVSLDYQATPDLLVYLTHRGSWRSGGINFTGIPINSSATNGGNLFDPETTKDIEAGVKFNGRLGHVPLTFAAAAYHQWVDNVQRAVTGSINGNPALFTANAPRAEITGVEFSFTSRPVAWLELGASGAYTNARFTRASTLVLGLPVVFGPYGDAPEWAGSAFAQVTAELGGDQGTIALRGDIYGQTASFFSNLANTRTPGTELPGYVIANGRLSWERIFGSTLTSALYVRNIFDREYFAGGLATNLSFGLASRSPARPRTYGVEVRLNF